MAVPFFSVIIPVYNRAKTLCAAIESVRAQTCQDFEIVVVDDGSDDDPRASVESFGDPRIRFFRQDNAGGGAARNRAIDEARGRFIAPLDSDDVFLPHHLASMKSLLDGTTGIVGYARMRVDRGEGRIFLKPPRAIGPGEDMASYLLCDRGFVPTITVVVERQAAQRIRYNTALRDAEDTDFAVRLFLAGHEFRMLDEPGAVWKDIFDASRASSSHRGDQFYAWLEQMRPQIPTRAYHGGLGWGYARLIAREQPWRAFGLYLNALAHGCFRPSLAVVIFLQIFLGRAGYRRLADKAIAWLRVGLRDTRKLEQA
ncbi:MAG TPA: glycosyltransferase family A protein [Rhizomicrobium sp.]|jgi:glycosyltransferase involved in cell wall biosynthesis